MSLWIKIRDKVFGAVKEEFTADEQALVAWAHNLLVQITPVVKQAAEDAVAAAENTPGNGEVRAAAALAAAIADLTSKGVPIVVNAIKGAIEIAFANTRAPIATVQPAAVSDGAGSGTGAA